MISKDTTFVIVGLGLLGGSYAKGLKEAGYRVYGIARRQETIDYALNHRLIDEGSIGSRNTSMPSGLIPFSLMSAASK